MQLIFQDLSKKFFKNRLFENLNKVYYTNHVYAITGANGSGKSTLLKIIAGVLAPSKGYVILKDGDITVSKDDFYSKIGICAPYLDLIDEFTLKELIKFQLKFKKAIHQTNIEEEIKLANLDKSWDKPIAEFSSGMQQRVKLILACCFQSEVLLLDEPTSHLDEKGCLWYHDLLKRKFNNRITLIFSNNSKEYISFTEDIYQIIDYSD